MQRCVVIGVTLFLFSPLNFHAMNQSSATQVTSFFEFDLIEPLQRAIVAAGYRTPTPIQAAAIGPLLQGKDLLGCAQTGTGKTAAFALPILQKLHVANVRGRAKCPRVLVLSPTRELATQIADSFATYGKHLRVRMATVFGGVSPTRQIQAFARGVEICVATPGRLLDLFQQGAIWFDDVDTFVLDEADRMLDMGFLPDLKRIIKELPPQRQSLFFSATMLPPVRKLAAGLLTDHVEVIVTPPASTVKRIKQKLLLVQRSDKARLLKHLVETTASGQVLVFTKTKRGADRLAKQLKQADYRCEVIHGDKTQATRDRVLQGFKKGSVDILIATDLAARGIDVEGLQHVINFDIPHDAENYVHRIGRTGRAGAKGTALTLGCPEEHEFRIAVEKLIGDKIPVDTDHPYHHAYTTAESPRSRTRGPQARRRTYATGKPKRQRGSTAPINPSQHGTNPRRRKSRR